MKKCPFCKKEIGLNDTECSFCKMVLAEKVSTSSSQKYTSSSNKSSTENIDTHATPNKSSSKKNYKSKYNKYLRPYCKNCKVIYSLIKNIGLKNCTQCYQPLIFKSFNPYPNLIIGIAIFIVAIATVVISASPIIWIGGFIWGAMMLSSSFDNWEKIKKLDEF